MSRKPIDTAIGQLGFGAAASQDRARLLSGWADPEDGFTWAIGIESRFLMPVLEASDRRDIFLEMDINPFVPPDGKAGGQRLHVFANGVLIGADRIGLEGTLAYQVPHEAIGASVSNLTITLRTPDAIRPADFSHGTDNRVLAFMFRSAALRTMRACPPLPQRRILPPLALPSTRDPSILTPALRATQGLDTAELLSGFESLGHNCEFGVAQRHMGAEPLGLLRFAGISVPDLMIGLQASFDGVGQFDQLDFLVTGGSRPEFIIHDRRYRLSLHTMRYVDETDAETLHADAERHLGFLHRRFLKTCADGKKIFVFQRPGPTLLAQALPLLIRLRALGGAALLFVVEGDEHPPGTVEELGYGFFRGWSDHMAPHDNVGLCNLAAWVSNCANARRLWDVQRAFQPPSARQ